MALHSFIATAAAAIMTILSHATAARAAEIRVLCTGAARAALSELAPQFERATGHKLIVQYDLPPTLIGKINAGEPFDVVILSHDVEGLIGQGSVVRDSRTVLGRTGVGVAIPQGAPKPDIGTVDAFKRALLDAKAIATSGEGSSGRYVLTLLDRLGIAEQVKPKLRSGPLRRRRAIRRQARSGLRRHRAAAGHRRSRRRMARLDSGRIAELGDFHRRPQRRGQGAGGGPRAARLPHRARCRRGVQGQGA